MNKKEIRKEFLTRRRAMEQSDFELKCEQIRKQFVNTFHLEDIRNIHCYLPILKHKEINTWLIIDSLRKTKPGIQIVASVSQADTYAMHNYVLEADTPLVHNQWGIPEPSAGVRIEEKEIDMVLVPLLAFDKEGHRVGYGKGFYDRFLSKCRLDVVTVGLSLEEPLEYIEETHEYDHKLDYCVTPEKVWTFK